MLFIFIILIFLINKNIFSSICILFSDQADYFEIKMNDNRISILANIPKEVLNDDNYLMFYITATKPRSIEVSTVVFIELPSGMKTYFKFCSC